MATKKKSAALKFLDKLIGEQPMTLGGFMKSDRNDEGLSLAEMADKLRVSRQHLQAVEAGRSNVSVERAIRWARILGYDEQLFVELALQSEVTAAGCKLRVKVEAA